MMHDRIGNQSNSNHILGHCTDLGGALVNKLTECFPDNPCHIGFSTGVHHDIGYPAHQILSEADLRIHDAVGGQHIACHQVTQVCSDRGRAYINSNAQCLFCKAWPYSDDIMVLCNSDGNLPVILTQCLLQRGQDRWFHGKVSQVPFVFKCSLQALQVPARCVHVRFLHFNIVKTHKRVELDIQ